MSASKSISDLLAEREAARVQVEKLKQHARTLGCGGLEGQRIGRMELLQYLGGRRHFYRCRCDCGKVGMHALRSMYQSVSCGCWKREWRRLQTEPTKHGLTGTKIYWVWDAMIRRCADPKNKDYRHYGGRGISVCEEWKDINRFISDMGFPNAGMTIERINNDGNYCKENCRWATRFEQGQNRRNTLLIEHNGTVKTLREWSIIYGIPIQVLYGRRSQGCPTQRLFLTAREYRYGPGSNWRRTHGEAVAIAGGQMPHEYGGDEM